MIATAAGVQSNLEVTLPIVVVCLLMVLAWDNLVRFLRDELDQFSELLDPQDGPPLMPVNGSRPTGVVERRPEDRERARRERDEARLSRQRMEGQVS